MHSAISLHEYREHYPGIAATPTLTQTGLVGPLMKRLAEASERRKRRNATRDRLLDFLFRPLTGLRRRTTQHSSRAMPLAIPRHT